MGGGPVTYSYTMEDYELTSTGPVSLEKIIMSMTVKHLIEKVMGYDISTLVDKCNLYIQIGLEMPIEGKDGLAKFLSVVASVRLNDSVTLASTNWDNADAYDTPTNYNGTEPSIGNSRYIQDYSLYRLTSANIAQSISAQFYSPYNPNHNFNLQYHRPKCIFYFEIHSYHE